jgi:hypothetical protein
MKGRHKIKRKEGGKEGKREGEPTRMTSSIFSPLTWKTGTSTPLAKSVQ